MSFLYVTCSRNLLKRHSATSKKNITTKDGGNTYKNEMVAYLYMTCDLITIKYSKLLPLKWL